MALLQQTEKQLSYEDSIYLNNYCLFGNIKRAQEDKSKAVFGCAI